MSGPLTALSISVAGGMGAALRLVLDGLIRARVKSTYPVGTTVINVTGSFLLGLVTGLATSQLVSHQWQLVVGTGFLGGYTTFSAFSLDTVLLWERGQHALAGGYVLASVAASIGGLVLALALVRHFT